MATGTFVYCVCGERHALAVETSLRFLKRVSRADIVVVAARTGAVAHDQTFHVEVPAGLSDHQASILLKTSLPRLVAVPGVACYLDSDQVAVSPDVDTVFAHYAPPITFAADHTTLDVFGRSAVRCGCPAPRCDHLRLAILEKFGVAISDPAWPHWNGGMFLFTGEAEGFAARWRDYTALALDDPYWNVRDQGTLVAAAWSFGLQGHPTLSARFNRIVDRFRGHHEASRAALAVGDYHVARLADDPQPPAFLHFINGGMGKRGWTTWDDAEALLAAPAAMPEALAC